MDLIGRIVNIHMCQPSFSVSRLVNMPADGNRKCQIGAGMLTDGKLFRNVDYNFGYFPPPRQPHGATAP